MLPSTHLIGAFSYASIVVWLMAVRRRCMIRNASNARVKAAANTNARNAASMGWSAGSDWAKKSMHGRSRSAALHGHEKARIKEIVIEVRRCAIVT